MNNSTKRKASAAGLSTTDRMIKRRASKACHCCRSRKVRCDVVDRGIPCTNCILDEVDCIVTEGKKRRMRKMYLEGEEKKESQHFPIFDNVDSLSDFVPALSGAAESNQQSNILCHHRPHTSYQTQGRCLSLEKSTRQILNISSKALPTRFVADTAYYPRLSGQPESTLPAYIKPIPNRITTEDLEFLRKKGAFIIPELSLRNELLRCYIQYVHPYCPLLNLQEFLTTIQKDQGTETISLLLFQATMFAATAYIDLRFLIAQGYVTRKIARKAFFQRVKLLYDSDYETDRVTIVQGVLLMTYWYENPDDSKDAWHWLGVAISMAQTIGLNYDTSNAPIISLQQRRLWKRIWWCCFMRDRLIAIGMRRPIRISHKDLTVSMLELTDFETDSLPIRLIRMTGDCSIAEDSSKQVTLARLCISLAKLCVCIGQILAVQYSTVIHKIGASQETTIRLVPKKHTADLCDIMQCDHDLESWYIDVSQEPHHFTLGSPICTKSVVDKVLLMHKALLHGIYLTALSALHRPQIRSSTPDIMVTPDLRELSKRKVRQAANDITDIYEDLFVKDMIRFLPNTGVTCLLPAIVVYLQDLKSPEPAVREASIRRYHFCMQALQRLREIYASADSAFFFLDAAVRKTNAQLNAAAIPSGTTHSSISPPTEQKTSPSSTRLLTPQPEVMHPAGLLLCNWTLAAAPEERDLLAAFTPLASAGSEAGLHSYTLDRSDGALLDVSDFDCYKQGDRNVRSQMLEPDFDSLVSFQDCNDLFSSVEDGIELDTSWFDAFDESDMKRAAPSNGFTMAQQDSGEAETASAFADPSLELRGDLEIDLGIAPCAW